MSNITIIMYHYVRPIKNSSYPGIKGMEVSSFETQLKYLLAHYDFPKIETVIDSIASDIPISSNRALLTFDDGYIDHFQYVFPILKKYGVQGIFFPVAEALVENIVLDINKIHFIIASSKNISKLLSDTFLLLDEFRKDFDLQPTSYYYDKLAIANRFDSADIIFFKRLFQRELQGTVKQLILDRLFVDYVFEDEKTFSRRLYMDINNLKDMQKAGMHIGSHGYSHKWLSKLSMENQQIEIDKSLEMLESIRVPKNFLTISYPFGDYNDSLLQIVKKANFRLGMTTQVDIADLCQNDPLTLPRLDTNDVTSSAL